MLIILMKMIMTVIDIFHKKIKIFCTISDIILNTTNFVKNWFYSNCTIDERVINHNNKLLNNYEVILISMTFLSFL